jgi:hypothetical protein
MAEIQHQVIDGPLGFVLIIGLMSIMCILVLACQSAKQHQKVRAFLDEMDAIDKRNEEES